MIGQKKGPASFGFYLAAETKEQGLSKKLDRYDLAKQRTMAVSDYIVEHDIKMFNAKNLHDCGSWLVFRNYHTVDQHRLIKANLCKKHNLCGLCAMRRSALQVKAFEPKFNQVLSENPHLKPVLITFTIKNGSDFQERFLHLKRSQQKMIKRRNSALNGINVKSVMTKIIGGAGSFEFKRGAGSGEWHPHIHMIAFLNVNEKFTAVERKGKTVYVPLQFESDLRNEWFDQTGDSHMVDVRLIQTENEDDKFGAICEAFKYALKLNDLSIEDQVNCAKFLHNRRLQFTFGILHAVKIKEDLTDDLIDDELLPYIDMVFKYTQDGYQLEEITDYGSLEKDFQEKHITSKNESQNSEFNWKKEFDRFVQSDQFTTVQQFKEQRICTTEFVLQKKGSPPPLNVEQNHVVQKT